MYIKNIQEHPCKMMIHALLRKMYEKIIPTKNPKIIPKKVEDNMQHNNDDDSPEEIFNDRFALIKRRSQMGNLISYRSRVQSIIIYPEQQEPNVEEIKEESFPESPTNVKNFTIKTTLNVIKTNETQEILNKYNEMKPPNWPPLEILQRAEGGFQIEIPEKKNIRCANQNEKIKQLRWMNKALVCRSCYTTFNEKELQILYRAMHSVLSDNVYLE